ncbi:phosphoesterase family-domain-containing protein [Hygrophoropsis aurantiaca]|uniref:Phosphoesterase family-domain-containing protein n=1 Tax=Hygrophoropsis aurantiaca TaxID=72124 RepID=A0ACB7ZZM7_9AGAM|nr:phosphoesterase family-domain-containing protein [Hygrophoropsis aurantiaca]
MSSLCSHPETNLKMIAFSIPGLSIFGALVIESASAAVASTFTAPAAAPTDQSPFYVGASNGTITNSPLVAGKVFDRFIQIWLENTNFAAAASQAVFQNLSTQGITLTEYYGVTHTSEPNYLAAGGGDFWGLYDDDFEAVPNNISTIVDLLDQKAISWSAYQENMPYDGYEGYNYTNQDDGYTYYVRKHNPLIIYDSVSQNTTRSARIRNFNDFAVDLGNNTISQWVFVTPNLRNDGHDTTVAFAAEWLNYWLVPLLEDPNFNTDRTLILLTFDENETYTINNQVYAILLGGAIPTTLRNTTDSTFYTHYSTLTTVEANWDLGNLGRQDTNKTVSNVFSFVASDTGYTNNNISGSAIPLLNLTTTIPGPLNPEYYVPYLAPTNGTGGGSGPTFFASNVNMSLNAADAPAPVNLTAAGTSGSSEVRVGLGLLGTATIGAVIMALL